MVYYIMSQLHLRPADDPVCSHLYINLYILWYHPTSEHKIKI